MGNTKNFEVGFFIFSNFYLILFYLKEFQGGIIKHASAPLLI
jgi:hypothetical protein